MFPSLVVGQLVFPVAGVLMLNSIAFDTFEFLAILVTFVSGYYLLLYLFN